MSRSENLFGFTAVLTIVIAMAIYLQPENYAQESDPSAEPVRVEDPGKSIYEEKCAICHGVNGDGESFTSGIINPRPRNLKDGIYKVRSTASGSIPTDADIIKTISKGLHGTAMPGWKPFLNKDSLEAVTSYIKTFSERFETETPIPISIGRSVPSTRASIERGRTIYGDLECADCHGDDGSGDPDATDGMEDDWGYPITPTMLTEPWTFKGGASAEDVAMRIFTGMLGSPMPSYEGLISTKSLRDLSNYVVFLARKPIWEMNAQELESHYAEMESKNAGNLVARGEELVESLDCGNCHTHVTEEGLLDESMNLAGGTKIIVNPFGVYVTRNLTPDEETGLGKWTDEEIFRKANI